MQNNNKFKRKNSLAPIEDPKPPASSDKITEGCSIDEYIEADFNDKKIEFSDTDRDTMSKEIIELREEIENLKTENSRLIAEISTLKNNTDIKTSENYQIVSNSDDELSKKIEQLEFENDELILKNSEIEFELAKLRETNSALQSRIDTCKNLKEIERKPQISTPINSGTFRNNGYRDWR